MKAVAPDAARLEDLIARPGHHDRLAELGTALHVARLLQEIGADASGGLPEELGDVEDTEVGGGTQAWWQLEA